MADLSAEDIEIRAIKDAYDALKCLDPEGRSRAMTWLHSKFESEHEKAVAARHEAARQRVSATEGKDGKHG